MGSSREVNRTVSERDLQAWAQSVEFPPTPPIASRVGARLRAEGSASSRGLPVGGIRTGLIFAGLAFAAVVTVAVILLSRPPARPFSGVVVARAALVTPPPRALIRQTFEVVARGGPQSPTIVNVWEGLVDGRYTVVEVQPGRSPSAVRFVALASGVRRSWSSPTQHLGSALTLTLRARPVFPDGRLLCEVVDAGSPRTGAPSYEGRRRIAGRVAYVFRLRGRGVVFALDTRTLRLVSVTTRTYRAKLVASTAFQVSATPRLISTYITSRNKPNPSKEVTAAY